uniref:Mitochondrial carrier homolog 2 n=1 Tax=Paramormyrops kingsleyae TaxID=1676925 RepID=A0A3B3SUG6_9TELE
MADTCGQVVLGTGLTVLSHPLMYIKVLVQVGHEPLPPTTGRNIFGRQVNQLPGLFAYGMTKLQSDHVAPLCNVAVNFQDTTPCVISILVYGCQSFGICVGGWDRSTPSAVFACVHAEPSNGLLSLTALCLSRFPAKYIMKVDGKAGLFKGLVPRLCAGTVGTVVHSRVLQVSTLNSSNGIRNCSQAVTGFFASMLTYPFVLVSNLMAVNNCGLAGGLPPYASVYPTWLGCWRHLSLEGNMSRGNSLFFRKLPAGKMYAVDQKRFF